jgi:uncharacterized protein
MARIYLGQGIKFPFEVDNFGRIALANDAALIKQSLQILFSEPIGTEFYREHYGSEIRQALYEPNDAIVKSLLDYFIPDAIQKWEKRIQTIDVRYTQAEDKPDTIICTIFYLIKQANEIDSYIFPFYKNKLAA